MPDWCSNELSVIGNKTQVQCFAEQADERGLDLSERDPFSDETNPSILSFHRLFPVPTDVTARGYSDAGGAYDWQSKNWGIKRGAHEATREDGNNGVIYYFETAWMPPLAFVQKVSADFPELRFYLNFGMPDTGWYEDVTFVSGFEVENY